jgi:HEAT repeat protein
MNLNELETNILNNNIDISKKMIREIGEKKIKEASSFLLKYLKLTDNNVLRNCIAIALADIECEDAVKLIVSLLHDPKTSESRGTLLYALSNFNYLNYIDDIIELLFSNNFEVSRESFMLIEKIKDDISKDKIKEIIVKIHNEKNKLKERIEFLNESEKMIK